MERYGDTCDMLSVSVRSDISDIGQLGGNVSVPEVKADKISAALCLPTVASYNLRSLFPKIRSLKIDLIERKVDVGFLSEIWEQKQNCEHQFEIEKMLELSGLKYISTPRPPNKKGVSYGGAAIVVNLKKFSCEKLTVFIPSNLEVVWGILRPKNQSTKFKNIIVCSFYSPPNKRRNSKMADHIVTTLQMLSSKYPECGLILGADKNSMDIRPILNSGLRLRQVVDLNTINNQILDIIIMNLSGFYNSPFIAPPIQPDDPSKAKPSDHGVPVCVPHTDRYTPAERNYRIVKYRPLPDSSVRQFGEWLVSESWDRLKGNIGVELNPTQLSVAFEQLVCSKLNQFCPEKEVKLGSQDKAFISRELKKISRLKNREYTKRGKTQKYKDLERQFKLKYKIEAGKYLNKNLDALKSTKPGRAYSILKKMGAQPGDCIDSNTFSLPNHEKENLSEEQSAERIAQHFAEVSQQFLPLDVKTLPQNIQDKLRNCDSPPVVSEHDVYCKIRAANKPRSGIPNDLPKVILQEFAPELALPVSLIVNSIASTGEWPTQWKLEHIVPIGKIPQPQSEDDLRPISLTAFFSKVAEHFVVMWLMNYIKDKIDFRQYGGAKGNSITHYIIEFINFILSCQDSTDQIAILACMVDFSKAFNRQNHAILISKLSQMGVPGWLLKIVIGFLSNRKMFVKFKGKHSSTKSLPGGGPQGTLLGLLLFIVLINDVGFSGQVNNTGELITSKRNMRTINEIHLKYVDDLTLAEAINLPDKLKFIPGNARPRPDQFHARTGHVMPNQMENSRVMKQLAKTQQYAQDNDMKINLKKTKAMLFNPCTSIDFVPELVIDDQEIEVVEEMRLLGIIITSDMKWSANTLNMVTRAYQKLWVLRRLKKSGAKTVDLVDIYCKQVRSLLELAVPAWNGGITVEERMDIERVQKSACHIILGDSYASYRSALIDLDLESLAVRQNNLSLKFAIKAEKHPKHRNWFKLNTKTTYTRQSKSKYKEVFTKHSRFQKSSLSFLTGLLNKKYCK